MLYFKKVILCNFRQYYGIQEISFSCNKDKNTTIIHGINGAGKSSLFHAINWCLYGNLYKIDGSLSSKEMASKISFGDKVEARVELWIEKDGKTYVVKRRSLELKEVAAADNGADIFQLRRCQEDANDFQVFYEENGDAKLSNEPTSLVNSLLPSNAREYFLFDGEKIDKLTKPGHESDVKEAVRNILQITSLERGIEHLNEIEKLISKQAKRALGDSEESKIFHRLEELATLIEKEQEKLAKLQNSISAAELLKRNLNEKLLEIQAIEPYIKMRDTFANQLKGLESQKESQNKNIRELTSQSHFIIINKAVEKIIQKLQKYKEDKTIPPPISKSFIEDMLKKQICICGSSLAEGTEAHYCIKKFIDSFSSLSISAETLNDLHKSLLVINERAKHIKIALARELEDIQSTNDKIVEISSRIEEVKIKIADVPNVEAAKLEKEVSKTEEELDRLKELKTQASANLTSYKEEKKSLESDLQQIQKQKKKRDKHITAQSLASRARDVLAKCYETFASSKRVDIQHKMYEVFSTLIAKKNFFKKVLLTEDYKINVVDIYGTSAINELSAGERQVLSLSFITAMSHVTGGMIPLVMDTPFGRLFSEHRENIARTMPKLTNQWILMVQDEEASPRLLKILECYAGKQYDLNFDNGCTTIEERSYE